MPCHRLSFVQQFLQKVSLLLLLYGICSQFRLKMKVLRALLSLSLFYTAYAAPTGKGTYASNQSPHSAGVAQAELEKRITSGQCTAVAKAIWARTTLEVAYVLTMLFFYDLQLYTSILTLFARTLGTFSSPRHQITSRKSARGTRVNNAQFGLTTLKRVSN